MMYCFNIKTRLTARGIASPTKILYSFVAEVLRVPQFVTDAGDSTAEHDNLQHRRSVASSCKKTSRKQLKFARKAKLVRDQTSRQQLERRMYSVEDYFVDQRKYESKLQRFGRGSLRYNGYRVLVDKPTKQTEREWLAEQARTIETDIIFTTFSVIGVLKRVFNCIKSTQLI